MAKVPEPRINEQIRTREVRLIDEDGTQLGVRPIGEALALALTRGKDLLEVAPGANPPVAKIADFSKYRYERDKKFKESRKHQKAGLVKEIRLHPRIFDNDLLTKVNHAKDFLNQRFKVKVTVVFRGREMEHRQLGLDLLQKFQVSLDSKFVLEQEAQLDGNRMSILVAPKR